jgi:hypothetical protein
MYEENDYQIYGKYYNYEDENIEKNKSENEKI